MKWILVILALLLVAALILRDQRQDVIDSVWSRAAQMVSFLEGKVRARDLPPIRNTGYAAQGEQLEMKTSGGLELGAQQRPDPPAPETAAEMADQGLENQETPSPSEVVNPLQGSGIGLHESTLSTVTLNTSAAARILGE